MTVCKYRLDRVIANWGKLGDADFTFANLQHLLAWAVTLYFGRR